MQAIEELAKADGSTAWCVVQACGCSMAAAYVAPKVAREIFGDAARGDGLGPGRDRTPRRSRSRAAIGRRGAGASPAASSMRAGSAVTARRRARRHAAAWRRRQAGRTHHADPEGEREDQRHLARGRPQGHRQRQLRDRRPVRAGRVHASRANPPPTAARRGPLYRFTTFHLYGTGFAAIALGLARAHRSMPSSRWPQPRCPRPRPSCCATMP